MASSVDNTEQNSPISLSRFNLKPIPPRVQHTCCGKIRAFNTFTALEWVYLSIALIALSASLGLTIQRLIVENPGESDFTFAVLLLFTIVFCYHYVIHSIFTERWDELMVFVTSIGIVSVYCVVNYFNVESTQPTVKLVRLILVCILGPFLIGYGIYQSFKYCQSNNLIFNTVGGSSSLQKTCRIFYICSSLLKFDLQLQLSMLILVMGKGMLSMTLRQQVILASGVPVTFLFIIIGFLGLRYENKTLMILFFILGLFEPAYIIYKFYYTVTYEKDVDVIYDSTFVCGYFALVVWVLLIVSTTYFVLYHFGNGLKEKLFEDKAHTYSRPSLSSPDRGIEESSPDTEREIATPISPDTEREIVTP